MVTSYAYDDRAGDTSRISASRAELDLRDRNKPQSDHKDDQDHRRREYWGPRRPETWERQRREEWDHRNREGFYRQEEPRGVASPNSRRPLDRKPYPALVEPPRRRAPHQAYYLEPPSRPSRGSPRIPAPKQAYYHDPPSRPGREAQPGRRNEFEGDVEALSPRHRAPRYPSPDPGGRYSYGRPKDQQRPPKYEGQCGQVDDYDIRYVGGGGHEWVLKGDYTFKNYNPEDPASGHKGFGKLLDDKKFEVMPEDSISQADFQPGRGR